MNESFDRLQQGTELTPSQKEVLFRTWPNIVTDTKSLERDTQELSDAEFREELSVSVLSNALAIAKEWDLIPETVLADEELSAQEKAEKEVSFIREINGRLKDFLKDNPKDKKRSRYCFYPKKIEEDKNFNCVGISTIASSIFEDVGFENYIGQVAGHVMNIVRLSDGRWLYVDYNNNFINEIEPEFKMVKGRLAGSFDEDGIIYKYIVLTYPDEIPAFILGTFEVLLDSMKKGDEGKSEIEKENEKEAFEDNRELCQQVDLKKVILALYGDLDAIDNSKKMNEERNRVKKIREDREKRV